VAFIIAEYGGKTFWDLKAESTARSCTKSLPAATVTAAIISARPAYSKKDGGYKECSGPAGWGSPNGIKAY
jgi:hypothetical protein